MTSDQKSNLKLCITPKLMMEGEEPPHHAGDVVTMAAASGTIGGSVIIVGHGIGGVEAGLAGQVVLHTQGQHGGISIGAVVVGPVVLGLQLGLAHGVAHAQTEGVQVVVGGVGGGLVQTGEAEGVHVVVGPRRVALLSVPLAKSRAS